MKDKTTHNQHTKTEQTDNLAQEAKADETTSTEQNIPESNDASSVEEGDPATKLQAELDEMRDKHLRLVAEFDNFRRRNAKERIELIQTAGRETLQSLLVVMDDMDRADKQLEATTDINTLKEGVLLVFNKLRGVLTQKGLKPMDATGHDFDPDLHEAITEIPAPSEEMKGKVIDVVEKGYYLNDKLIRHAKVVVGK